MFSTTMLQTFCFVILLCVARSAALLLTDVTVRPRQAHGSAIWFNKFDSCHLRVTALASSQELQEATTSKMNRDALARRLPPREKMTKLEVEFRELLEGILYTPLEMQAICSPRIRKIYEGVAASYHEPAVYRAFEVLYEDYLPLRIGGKAVYRRLRQLMDESLLYRAQQIQTVVDTTGIEYDSLEPIWGAFVQLGKSRRLNTELFMRTLGQTPSFLQHFDVDSSSELAAVVDPNRQGFLTFQELLVSLHNHSCNENGWLNELAEYRSKHWEDESSVNGFRLNEKRNSLSKQARYNERYDHMLEKFDEWRELIPAGQGRRLDIVHGCFVGARNPKVVEALRVIYVDYSALRVCGDWIFKVVSALIGARKPTQLMQ